MNNFQRRVSLCNNKSVHVYPGMPCWSNVCFNAQGVLNKDLLIKHVSKHIFQELAKEIS